MSDRVPAYAEGVIKRGFLPTKGDGRGWRDAITTRYIKFIYRESLPRDTKVRVVRHGTGYLCRFPGPQPSGLFMASESEIKEL